MCGSSSSSPHSCSRVIFANASQAAGFSTRSSDGEGRGGGWKRTEDGKGRGFDSPVVSFFSPPWLAPYQATFFSQLFNDERASRRRCCLSSAMYKSCAKLARRTPSALFPPLYVRLCSTEIHDTWGNFNPVSLSTAKPTLRFFSARVGRIERGYDKVEILGL